MPDDHSRCQTRERLFEEALGSVVTSSFWELFDSDHFHWLKILCEALQL